MQFQIHLGSSRNVGPIQLFSAFEGIGSPNNVIDSTTELVASCPSGRCRVGILGDGRTMYIDGIEVSSGFINVNVNALGKMATLQVEVVPAAVEFPAAIVVDTGMIGAEYPTPASR